MAVVPTPSGGSAIPQSDRNPAVSRSRFRALLALLLCLAAVPFWSCNTDPAEENTVTLKLDSSRVGKFDSVRVEIYNGKSPDPGDTANPVQTQVLQVGPATREITIKLDGKVKPDFSVVVTGFSGDRIAYRNLQTVDGFAPPDSTRPAVLLISRILAEDLTLDVGETRKPVLRFDPENPGDKRIVLRALDPGIVEVTGDSLRGLAPGKARIGAATPDGKVTVTFAANVTAVRVTGLLADTLQLKVGDSVVPAVKVVPDNATDKGYALGSGDTALFTVEGKAVVGRKAGQGKLYLSSHDGGAADTVIVRVRVPVTGIAAKDQTRAEGDRFAPVLEFQPADATRRGFTLSTSDSAKVAVVGDKDSLEAKGIGTATITVRTNDGGFTADFRVEVVKKVVRLAGAPVADLRALVGDTLPIHPDYRPADASEKGFTLQSLDTAIVGTAEERIIAKALGKARIRLTAVDGGIQDSFEVSVEKPEFKADVLPVTSLKCAPCHVPGTNLNFQDSVTLLLNGTKALDRLERPVGDPGKMPVAGAPNGALDARQLGIVLSWLQARVVPLKGVTVANDSVRLGKSKEPAVTWNPPAASNKSFTLLSLDTSKVAVNGSQLQGVALGSAQVQLRALEGDRLVTFTVTVIPNSVDSIRIADTTATLGDTLIPVIRFYPPDATTQTYALNKLRPASPLTTVLPGKRIVANALGKDTLVATSTDGAKVAQFTVTVGPVPPKTIAVADTNSAVNGPLVTPRAIWTPANTTDKSFTLAIDPADTAIAAVRGGAQIQAKAIGSILVTASSKAQPAVTATFKFTVGPVAVLSLSAAPVTAYPASSLLPELTWNPANATNQTYSLSSEDTAKVKITGGRAVTNRLGTATVTVTSADGAKTAPWDITIIRSPFQPTVKPIIVAYCGSCHNPGYAPTNWQDSATAVLNRAEMVRRTGLPPSDPAHMPPSSSAQPPPISLITLRAWLSQE